MAEQKMQQNAFTKVEQLRPLAGGLMLTVKVISSKTIMPRGRSDGNQGRQMRLAECLVGDETGMIIFTARNDQGLLLCCVRLVLEFIYVLYIFWLMLIIKIVCRNILLILCL